MPDADRQIAMDVETEPFAPSARSPLADTWVHLYLFLLHLVCLFVFFSFENKLTENCQLAIDTTALTMRAIFVNQH